MLPVCGLVAASCAQSAGVMAGAEASQVAALAATQAAAASTQAIAQLEAAATQMAQQAQSGTMITPLPNTGPRFVVIDTPTAIVVRANGKQIILLKPPPIQDDGSAKDQ